MNKNYGISVVRVGVSLVFIWFGASQLMDPTKWVALVPGYAMKILPLTANSLVLGNGVFEVVFGILLLVGFYTRFASALLTLHAAHIVAIVGYNAIGVRDFCIFMSSLGIFLNGPDNWALDRRLTKTLPPIY
jgi:uncharacterized membrane protein YphA (DoxX/SURF4 family)